MDLALETDESYQTYASSILRKKHRVTTGVVEEMLQNPGRFSSPLSLTDRLQLKIVSMMSNIRFLYGLQEVSAISYSSLPYSWGVLINYLNKKGVITQNKIFFSKLQNDAPKNFSFELKSVITPRRDVRNSEGNIVASWGNAFDPETALSKCVGEILERHFLWTYPETSKMVKSSVSGFDSRRVSYLDPSQIVYFSEKQKKNFPKYGYKGEDDIFSWVRTRNLMTNQLTYVPAQLVFCDFSLVGDESILTRATTNGAAGHFTFEEAVLAALYENVERDGFLIHWLNHTSPKRISIKGTINKNLIKFVDSLGRYNFEVFFLDVTTDIGIPSFVCVLIDHSSKGPRVAIGGGAGWNVAEVLLETCCKTLASYRSIDELSMKRTFGLDGGYTPFGSSQFVGRKERLLLWMDPQMFEKIKFLFDGEEININNFSIQRSFPSISQEFRFVLDIFRRLGKGYEVYVYEVENEILKTLNYHVVKVIIPQLVPMYLVEQFAPLGCRRLLDVPKKLGWKVQGDSKWNPWPHPFP